jgi:hypothetical protein
MSAKCINCGKDIEPDDGIWYHVENRSMLCDGDDSTDLTRQADPADRLEIRGTITRNGETAEFQIVDGEYNQWGNTVAILRENVDLLTAICKAVRSNEN